jgi:hypothetical protein
MSACACGTELGSRNKSGLCRSCRARKVLCNPEVQSRAVAGLRKHLSDPVNHATRVQASAENLARWRASPEGRERLLANATASLVKARQCDNEERKRRIRRAAYPGIPESRWDECAKLAKGMPAAEAKRLIREDEALKERKRVSALSPFERDMERLAKGAGLVPQFRPRKADHGFSIVGSSMA